MVAYFLMMKKCAWGYHLAPIPLLFTPEIQIKICQKIKIRTEKTRRTERDSLRRTNSPRSEERQQSGGWNGERIDKKSVTQRNDDYPKVIRGKGPKEWEMSGKSNQRRTNENSSRADEYGTEMGGVGNAENGFSTDGMEMRARIAA